MITVPEPAEAPVILPVMAPMVQEKLLAMLDVKVIFGLVLPQLLTVATLVTEGEGFTVTVIVNGIPIHPFPVEVGVTRY